MVAAITLTPATGNVGSTCTIDGTGFAFSEVISFTYGGVEIIPAGAPISSDGAGAFSAVITIPASTQGIHAVVATDVSLNSDSENYTVTSNLVITEANTTVGATINVTGTGFAATEAITFTFATNPITAVEDPVSSNATGGFTASFVVPASTNGSKTLDATDVSLNTDSDTVIVDALIVITEANITVGGTINFTGSGFAATEVISFTFNGSPATPVEDPISSNATGGFTGSLVIGAMVNGSKTLVATDVSLNTDSDTVIIDALLVITQATGTFGDTINVVGSGYATVSAMSFTLDAIAIVPVGGAINTDATGGFTTTFLIPEVPNSTRSLVGTDGSANNDADTIDIIAICIITEANAKYGDTITVVGHGYEASSAVTTTLNGVGITAVGGAFSTGATGGFNKTFVIPDVANGTRTFVAADAGAGTDSDTIVIDAYITIDDASGSVGDTVVISGHGFTATSLMAFTFGGSVIVVDEDPLSSGATGAFTATITVPSGFDDVVSIVATDAGAKTDSITFNVLIITGGEIVENTTFKHLSGRDNRLRSVNSVPSRERGSVVDITFTADDTYDTGGVTLDFSGIDNFSQVYLCKVIHNGVGLVCSYVPAAGNAAASGKLKFWGTDGNELADNSSAITSKTMRLFIRGI